MKTYLFLFTLIIVAIIAILFYLFKDTIRIINNEKILLKAGVLKFNIVNEKMFVWTTINNQKVKLQFDTGATQYFLTDASLFKSHSLTKTFNVGLSDDSKINSYLGSINMQNELLSGTPLSASYIDRIINHCDNTKGYFSLVNFVDEESEIELNFEKHQISSGHLISNKNEYAEVEMKVDFSGLINIKLQIDEKEDWFVFDTGALSTIIYPFDNANYNKINFNAITADKKKIKEILTFEAVPTIIGKEKLLVDINRSENITRKLVGVMFIRKFNWILDFKNNKIYFKKIDKEKTIKSFQQPYAVRNLENKLVISAKNNIMKEYEIGDEITSVNDIKITTQNICEMQKLLNTSNNWGNLNILIASKDLYN